MDKDFVEGLAGDSPTYVRIARRVVREARDAVSIRPIFLSPQQGAGESDECPISWWHIPVRLHKPWCRWRAELKNCEVHLWITPHNGQKIGPIPLRWRKRGQTGGAPYVTLTDKAVELIPVAMRRELKNGRGGIAVISSNLEDHKDDKILAPGRYSLSLELRDRRGDRWPSDNNYQLNVPVTEAGNGLFYLEIKYPEQY